MCSRSSSSLESSLRGLPARDGGDSDIPIDPHMGCGSPFELLKLSIECAFSYEAKKFSPKTYTESLS